MKTALLASLVMATISCAGANQADLATTAPNRADYTAKAADCRFAMPDSSLLMGESEVDDPPRMASPGTQRYPPQLQLHGIPGRVTVTYVIGRDGLVVRPSLRIVEATNDAFIPSTEEMIYSSRYSPGAHLGAPVATCVRQVVNFTLQ